MRLGRRSIRGRNGGPRTGGRSCIVPAMDDDRPAPEQLDPSRPGPLTRETAIGLLARADDLLHAGEYQAAAAHYVRVVGFDDPAVTAAALLGLGEARYRLDDEDGAVANWEAVVELGETPSTYRAWRNLAASSVRMRRPRRGDARVSRGGPPGPARGQGGDREPAGLARQGDRRHRARRSATSPAAAATVRWSR